MAAAAVATVSGYASIAAAHSPVKMADGVLTNAAGMTLYTFDRDAGNKSACKDRYLGAINNKGQTVGSELQPAGLLGLSALLLVYHSRYRGHSVLKTIGSPACRRTMHAAVAQGDLTPMS